MKAKTRGLDAADNGNEFLCYRCTHGKKRSGTNKEVQVFCAHDEFPGRTPVPFAITQCDGYSSKEAQHSYYALGSDLKQVALYLDRREMIKGQRNPDFGKFVDAIRAIETKLIYDHWL